LRARLISLRFNPHHDAQGKFASGPGVVRSSLTEAKTISQINAAASTEARRITGRNIHFDMTGSDPQTAREHSEGVLRGLERFPGANPGWTQAVS